MNKNKWQHNCSLWLIVSLSILLYANTLENGFVYDDEFTIVNNTLIKSFNNLPLLLKQDDYFASSGELSYRPVVTLTYLFDYSIYGLKPWGYHLTNILLHLLNGVLLYTFLTLLFTESKAQSREAIPERNKPLLISLLFVSHPVLTEAVNAISYREDLLVFLFYMSTLILYIKSKDKKRPSSIIIIYLLSCLFYLIALFSKEMAITLPLIVYCYERFYGYKKRDSRSALFNSYNISYIVITCFYLYIRFGFFYNAEEEFETWRLIDRMITVPWLLLRYFTLSIFPVSLCADYMISPLKSLFSLIFIFSIFMFVCICTIITVMGKIDKMIAFGILFFIITLMPVYNIVPIANPFAERYLYLSTVGFVIVVGQVFNFIYYRDQKHGYRNYYIIQALFLILLSIYSISVISRNMIWKDQYLLWSDTVRKMPNSYRAHGSLGSVYAGRNMLNEAIGEYLTAIKLQPYHVIPHINLGHAYYKQKRLDEAMKVYTRVLKLNLVRRLNPYYADVHNNIGNIYVSKGQLNEAILEYKTAIELRPDSAGVYHNLGNAYYDQNRLNEAIQNYQTALKLQPDFANAHLNIGNAYADLGRMIEAISAYQAALTLKHDLPEAHYNLGNIYAVQGEIDRAIQEYRTALKLTPDNIDAHYNLGLAYKKRGIEGEAQHEFETVLKLNPVYIPAQKAK